MARNDILGPEIRTTFDSDELETFFERFDPLDVESLFPEMPHVDDAETGSHLTQGLANSG